MVKAREDGNRAYRAEDEASNNRGDSEHPLDSEAERIAEIDADRANDRKGKDAAGKERQRRREDRPHGLWQHLVNPAVDIAQGPYRQDDGDDIAGIAEDRHRDEAEEQVLRDLLRSSCRCHGRVLHGCSDSDRDKAIRLEDPGCRIGDEERQEREDAARDHVEHDIGIAGIRDGTDCHQACHEALDHASAGNGRHDRPEYARNRIHQGIDDRLLLLSLSTPRIFRNGISHQGSQFLEIAVDLGADDDLELARPELRSHDLRNLLQCVVVDFALVDDAEPQPGHAVPDIRDIVRPSYCRSYRSGDISVCHRESSLASAAGLLACLPSFLLSDRVALPCRHRIVSAAAARLLPCLGSSACIQSNALRCWIWFYHHVAFLWS